MRVSSRLGRDEVLVDVNETFDISQSDSKSSLPEVMKLRNQRQNIITSQDIKRLNSFPLAQGLMDSSFDAAAKNENLMDYTDLLLKQFSLGGDFRNNCKISTDQRSCFCENVLVFEPLFVSIGETISSLTMAQPVSASSDSGNLMSSRSIRAHKRELVNLVRRLVRHPMISIDEHSSASTAVPNKRPRKEASSDYSPDSSLPSARDLPRGRDVQLLVKASLSSSNSGMSLTDETAAVKAMESLVDCAVSNCKGFDILLAIASCVELCLSRADWCNLTLTNANKVIGLGQKLKEDAMNKESSKSVDVSSTSMDDEDELSQALAMSLTGEESSSGQQVSMPVSDVIQELCNCLSMMCSNYAKWFHSANREKIPFQSLYGFDARSLSLVFLSFILHRLLDVLISRKSSSSSSSSLSDKAVFLVLNATIDMCHIYLLISRMEYGCLKTIKQIDPRRDRDYDRRNQLLDLALRRLIGCSTMNQVCESEVAQYRRLSKCVSNLTNSIDLLPDLADCDNKMKTKPCLQESAIRCWSLGLPVFYPSSYIRLRLLRSCVSCIDHASVKPSSLLLCLAVVRHWCDKPTIIRCFSEIFPTCHQFQHYSEDEEVPLAAVRPVGSSSSSSSSMTAAEASASRSPTLAMMESSLRSGEEPSFLNLLQSVRGRSEMLRHFLDRSSLDQLEGDGNDDEGHHRDIMREMFNMLSSSFMPTGPPATGQASLSSESPMPPTLRRTIIERMSPPEDMPDMMTRSASIHHGRIPSHIGDFDDDDEDDDGGIMESVDDIVYGDAAVDDEDDDDEDDDQFRASFEHVRRDVPEATSDDARSYSTYSRVYTPTVEADEQRPPSHHHHHHHHHQHVPQLPMSLDSARSDVDQDDDYEDEALLSRNTKRKQDDPDGQPHESSVGSSSLGSNVSDDLCDSSWYLVYDICLKTVKSTGNINDKNKQLCRLLASILRTANYCYQSSDQLSKNRLGSLILSPDKCSDNIILSNSYKTASQRAIKAWGSVISDRPIMPHTGIHTWSVSMDKCEKGYVFVGVVTSKASTASYIGSDSYGWGVIGTRALWTGRSKVKSDYGEGFSTGSIVTATLDSNKGILSFSCGNTDWGVAFDKLPLNEPLFPAISLHQRDDQATIVDEKEKALDLAPLSAIASSEDNILASKLFGSIMSTVLSACYENLSNLEKKCCKPRRSIRLHLMDPLLTVLLPIVLSGLYCMSVEPDSSFSGILVIDLLPRLVMISRKLSNLTDILKGFAGGTYRLFGRVDGTWAIDSQAIGPYPAQSYSLTIHYEDDSLSSIRHILSEMDPTEESVYADDGHSIEQIELGEPSASLPHPIDLVRGEGSSGSSMMRLWGFTCGCRLRFVESWSSASLCEVNLKLSMDGQQLTGTFRDIKSGASGKMLGTRAQKQDAVYLSTGELISVYQRLQMASGAALGRLSGLLINSVLSLNVLSSERSHLESDISVPKPEDDGSSSNMEAKNETGDDEEASSQSFVPSTWASGSLLSGGMPVDFCCEKLKQVIGHFSSMMIKPGQEGVSNIQSEEFSYFQKAMFSSDGICRSDTSLPPIITDIVKLSSSFNESSHICETDHWIQKHINASLLIRAGGERARSIRLLLLAAVLRHSGCTSLLDARRSENERPHEFLIQIWQCVQMVVEQYLRSEASAGNDALLENSCLFLLRVYPNSKCALIESNLLLEKSSSSHKFVDGDNDISRQLASQLGESVHFLTSPSMKLDKLDDFMKSCQWKAMLRAAGLASVNCTFLKDVSKKPADIVKGALARKRLDQSAADDDDNEAEASSRSISSSRNIASVLECLVPCMFGQDDPASWNQPLSPDVLDSTCRINGHFLSNVKGCGKVMENYLRQSFEVLYSNISQSMERASWSHDCESMTTFFSCWIIPFAYEDHNLLNRVQIFKVFQNSLSDLRSNCDSQMLEDSDPESAFIENCSCKLYKRLVRLGLTVVQHLAEQVIFAGKSDSEGDQERGLGPQLSRSLFSYGSHVPSGIAVQISRLNSGAQTLGESLFELLFTELTSGLEKLVPDSRGMMTEDLPTTSSSSLSSLSATTSTRTKAIEILKNDSDITQESTAQHSEILVSRLLCLLSSMSSTPPCRAVLSRPKWLSLFISCIGKGNIRIQKSVHRVLQQLLLPMDPRCVKILPHSHSELAIAGNDTSLMSDSAFRIISSFLSIISQSMLLPGSLQELTLLMPLATRNLEFQQNLVSMAICILRKLMMSVEWRSAVNYLLVHHLRVADGSTSISQMISCLSVTGGIIPSWLVGGHVMLHPNCLLSPNDSLAGQISSLKSCHGILISLSDEAIDKATAEVLLIGKDIVCYEDGKVNMVSSVQGGLPVRPVKIPATEVFSSFEIDAMQQMFSESMFERLGQLLMSSLDRLGASGYFNTWGMDMMLCLSCFRSCSRLISSDLDRAKLKKWLNNVNLRPLITFASSERSSKMHCLELLDQRFSELYASRLWLLHNGSESRSRTQPTASSSTAPEPRQRLAATTSAATSFLSHFGPDIRNHPGMGPMVDQMMELGFPREWCETALRRTRFNVEHAVNFCFEHQEDMDQHVMEEQAVMQQRQQLQQGRVQRQQPLPSQERDLLRLRERRMRDDLDSDQEISRMRSVLDRDREEEGVFVSAATRQRLAKQLEDVGFPAHWCDRALERNGNDPSAAFSWVLGHADMLLEEDGAVKGSRSSVPAIVDGNFSRLGFNPLEAISGEALNDDNRLRCSSLPEGAGFASIGCRSFPARSGKWYYELTLRTAGCIQLGWADSLFEGLSDSGQGVGDDTHSWAFDGWRVYKWHGTSMTWGGKWKENDVIGCAADADFGILSFYLNGHGVEIGLGVAFSDIQYVGGIFPAMSFSKEQCVEFNFGGKPFAHKPPERYSPFIEHIESFAAMSPFCDDVSTPLSDTRDLMETQLCNDVTSWSKRYFTPDRIVSSRTTQLDEWKKLPSPGFTPLPDNVADIEHEMCKISHTLTALYATRIVISVLQSFDKAAPEPEVMNGLRFNAQELLNVVDGCSSFSNRTMLFCNARTILPMTVTPPPNIGDSIVSGGLPLLDSLRSIFCQLLISSRGKCKAYHNGIAELLLFRLKSHIKSACSKRYAGSWKMESPLAEGIVPSLPSELNGDNTPNLGFAVWSTRVLIEILAYPDNPGLATDEGWLLCGIFHDDSPCIIAIKRLIAAWVRGVHCGNVCIKLLAYRMLGLVVNNLVMRSLNKAVMPTLRELTYCIPIDRIQSYCRFRIFQEQSNHPISSLLLNSMLELLSLLDTFNPAESYPIDICRGIGTCGAKEVSSQSEDSLLVSSLAQDGFVLDDDVWEVWTGVVNQATVRWDRPRMDHAPRLNDNKGYPVPLIEGCLVSRRKKPRQRSKKHSSPGDAGEKPSYWSRNLRSNQHAFKEDDKTESTEVTLPEVDDSSHEEIGKVVKIVDWEGEIGCGRIIEWMDGTNETVRWGADGDQFDIVQIDDNTMSNPSSPSSIAGKAKYLERPDTEASIASTYEFGMQQSFGIILRIRRTETFLASIFEEEKSDSSSSFEGILEWPDFSSKVRVIGEKYSSGMLKFREVELLSGQADLGWNARFGRSVWSPGTEFEVKPSKADVGDEDGSKSHLVGQMSNIIHLTSKKISIFGEVLLQKRMLFIFDRSCCSSNMRVSNDGRAVAASSEGSSSGIVFGTVGFSSGVHYWEIKVDRSEEGSIFVGVCEKPSYPGHHNKLKLSRWIGMGVVNHRSSFNNSVERVYGNTFGTGDTIGVLLDANRGFVSFFLDGRKFDQHILEDLGVAVCDLRGAPSKVKEKTFFPVVGTRQSNDRVTITPRWFSSTGISGSGVIRNVSMCWQTLREISCSSPRISNDVLVEAYADYKRWSRQSRCSHLLTRGRDSIKLNISQHPLACVYASIRLGLGRPLFPGDKVALTMTSGRPLLQKETVEIVGAFKGLLAYKIENMQKSDNSSCDGSNLVWIFAPNDVEGMSIVSRSSAWVKCLSSKLNRQGTWIDCVDDFILPVLAEYAGGLIRVTFAEGAIARTGLEIDTSEIVGNIADQQTVDSFERRINVSNIARYRIIHCGRYCWVSENIRGGDEEVMAVRVPSGHVTVEELTDDKSMVEYDLNPLMIQASSTSTASIVSSPEAGVREWIRQVKNFLEKQSVNDDGLSISSIPDDNEGLMSMDAFSASIHKNSGL